MKTLNIKYIALILIVALFSTAASAQISKAEIIATGLTCSMCSNAINKQLQSLPEAVNVETDLNTNTFTVTLKEGNKLTPATFKEKVEKAGFFIGSLVLTVPSETVNKSPYVIVKDITNKPKQIKVQVLDKGYVVEKQFKKLAKEFKSIPTFASANEANFHVKVLN